MIVNETNRFVNTLLSHPNATQNSRIHCWKLLVKVELKDFLANVLFMGIVKMLSLKHYFSKSTSKYYMPFFKSNISFKRFELILKYLHFSKNNDERSDGYEDKIRKIFLFVKIIIENFNKIYEPSKNLSLDELMIFWWERLIYRQYIKTKKQKYGIKFYELCTPEGFVLNLLIHTCKEGLKNLKGGTFSKKVVMHLAKNYLDKGHHLLYLVF